MCTNQLARGGAPTLQRRIRKCCHVCLLVGWRRWCSLEVRWRIGRCMFRILVSVRARRNLSYVPKGSLALYTAGGYEALGLICEKCSSLATHLRPWIVCGRCGEHLLEVVSPAQPPRILQVDWNKNVAIPARSDIRSPYCHHSGRAGNCSPCRNGCPRTVPVTPSACFDVRATGEMSTEAG